MYWGNIKVWNNCSLHMQLAVLLFIYSCIHSLFTNTSNSAVTLHPQKEIFGFSTATMMLSDLFPYVLVMLSVFPFH